MYTAKAARSKAAPVADDGDDDDDDDDGDDDGDDDDDDGSDGGGGNDDGHDNDGGSDDDDGIGGGQPSAAHRRMVRPTACDTSHADVRTGCGDDSGADCAERQGHATSAADRSASGRSASGSSASGSSSSAGARGIGSSADTDANAGKRGHAKAGSGRSNDICTDDDDAERQDACSAEPKRQCLLQSFPDNNNNNNNNFPMPRLQCHVQKILGVQDPSGRVQPRQGLGAPSEAVCGGRGALVGSVV